ncbi:hypothetical protein [Paludisphaera soli]|uniref:hypothetical protein n=1 Tax=Paludisphaera soli TaxID=2712865 RepID=UPI0013EDFA7F|nr:hypothetical protein [Paludisphaera soli]
MAEHAIRLRAAWQAIDPDDPDGAPFRVDLPVDWASFPWPSGRAPRRLTLSRRFGRPAARGEGPLRAFLVLEAADGVRSIALDGESLPCRRTAPGRLVVDLPPLEPRNLLVVEVELPDPPPSAWGEAGLVFGPAGSGPEEVA